MRFGHEFRHSVGVINLAFAITGLVDALTDDFTAKAFIWAATLFFTILVVSYELIWYPRPENPFLEASLFALASLAAAWGVHGSVWVAMWRLVRGDIPDPIWLAPNYYISKNLFYWSVITALAINVAIVTAINVLSEEVTIEKRD